MKKRVKIGVDICMFILFLYLLSYRPGMGLLYHAVIGILQLSLFLVHHVLNLNWYKTLFKGKYRFQRFLLTLSDFLLLAAMIFMVLSSIMISGMIFDFGIRMTSIWRRIHVASSAWCFLLTGFHVGLHLQPMLNRIETRLIQFPWIPYILEALMLGFAVYCFKLSDLWPKMSMARRLPLSTLTSEESFGIYLAIIIGCSILIHWILKAARAIHSSQHSSSLSA